MLSDHPALAYGAALLLTLAVEIPIVACGLGRGYRVQAARAITIAAFASTVTHPVVWFLLPPLLAPTLGSTGYLLVAEGLAWLAEAGTFWLAVRRDPVGLLLLSLVANLSSFTLGAILYLVGLW